MQPLHRQGISIGCDPGAIAPCRAILALPLVRCEDVVNAPLERLLIAVETRKEGSQCKTGSFRI